MHILRHRHYLRTQNKIQQQQNKTKQNKTKQNQIKRIHDKDKVRDGNSDGEIRPTMS